MSNLLQSLKENFHLEHENFVNKPRKTTSVLLNNWLEKYSGPIIKSGIKSASIYYN